MAGKRVRLGHKRRKKGHLKRPMMPAMSAGPATGAEGELSAEPEAVADVPFADPEEMDEPPMMDDEGEG